VNACVYGQPHRAGVGLAWVGRSSSRTGMELGSKSDGEPASWARYSTDGGARSRARTWLAAAWSNFRMGPRCLGVLVIAVVFSCAFSTMLLRAEGQYAEAVKQARCFPLPEKRLFCDNAPSKDSRCRHVTPQVTILLLCSMLGHLDTSKNSITIWLNQRAPILKTHPRRDGPQRTVMPGAGMRIRKGWKWTGTGRDPRQRKLKDAGKSAPKEALILPVIVHSRWVWLCTCEISSQAATEACMVTWSISTGWGCHGADAKPIAR
jgi:hypothetical protein